MLLQLLNVIKPKPTSMAVLKLAYATFLDGQQSAAFYSRQSNRMMKLNLSVYRAYLAAAVVIVMMLVTRSQLQIGLSVEAARMASLSDLLVLGLLAFFYKLTAFYLPADSFIGRLNSWLHLFAVMLIVLLAVLSQALYLKTGELLNLDMLTFFLQRAGDLEGVAASAIDKDFISMLLMILAVIVLACQRLSNRFLVLGQYLALLLPIGFVFANPLIQPVPISDDLGFGEPGRFTVSPLYKGKYWDLANQQGLWNSPGTAEWQQGILTGMSVSSFSKTAIQVIGNNQQAKSIYEPQHVTQAGISHPNVLLVILESFRYDAVGAYSGTGQQTNTPFLDSIALKGWRVDRAYTTISHTTKALVGIYCGTFARMETDISEALPGNLPLTCLPRLLGDAGYRSAHFQAAIGTFEDRLPFLANVGFDDRFTQESFAEDGNKWAKLAYLGMDDRAMIRPAVDWMQRQKNQGRPFFASMLTIATHHPYVSPGHIEMVHDPVQAKAAYKIAVRYTDDWLRELFGRLQSQGLLDNTIVIITGDHGEGFFEHGAIAHNGTGYEEGIRVPLILSGPMLRSPKVVAGLRQHIDIMPTILDVAGVEISGKLPGLSLLGDSPGHAELITSCFYRDYCLTHLSADGGKAMFFYGRKEVEMYDLRNDTAESRNLYSRETRDNTLLRLGSAFQIKTSFDAVYAAKANHVVASSDSK